jgi:hypothetical protein
VLGRVPAVNATRIGVPSFPTGTPGDRAAFTGCRCDERLLQIVESGLLAEQLVDALLFRGRDQFRFKSRIRDLGPRHLL